MKKINAILLLAFLIFSSCKQHKPEDYNNLIAEARNLYVAGEYENSGEIYSDAFEVNKGSDTLAHNYEAARAWAMAGQKDEAFENLFVVVNKDVFINIKKISTDTVFRSLSTDQRWITVLDKVSENLKGAEARFSEISSHLETVLGDDQYYRQKLGDIQAKYGHESEEYRTNMQLLEKQDSINLLTVVKILDEHGWLGWDHIGYDANRALFLVIQHADIKTQEKYLPMLREAVKEGSAAPRDLALLEDRVALRQGKKQIYGSQIGRDQKTGEYYLSPLEDPDNVDERRAKVGLGPIQDYISYWGLTWDAEAYKKKIPGLEAKESKQN